jgi:hypothetical protein
VAFLFFQGAEYQFVVDNALGLLVGFLVEAGTHQGVGQVPLPAVHVAQGQAVAVEGRVVPEYTLPVQVVVGCLGLLLLGQAGQPLAGRLGHLGRRLGVSVLVVFCHVAASYRVLPVSHDGMPAHGPRYGHSAPMLGWIGTSLLGAAVAVNRRGVDDGKVVRLPSYRLEKAGLQGWDLGFPMDRTSSAQTE